MLDVNSLLCKELIKVLSISSLNLFKALFVSVATVLQSTVLCLFCLLLLLLNNSSYCVYFNCHYNLHSSAISANCFGIGRLLISMKPLSNRQSDKQPLCNISKHDYCFCKMRSWCGTVFYEKMEGCGLL